MELIFDPSSDAPSVNAIGDRRQTLADDPAVANIHFVSSSGGKYPVPEVIVLVVFVAVSILIAVKGYHHPALALAVWFGFGYTMGCVSRQIRQVRRIAQNKRRYGD